MRNVYTRSNSVFVIPRCVLQQNNEYVRGKYVNVLVKRDLLIITDFITDTRLVST